MPVVDVSFWDTLRFANWMSNGEGNASTESGAYTILGNSPVPSNASSLLANPQPNAGAAVWVPNQNQWYKAAYYDPANGTYSTYATQSDVVPGNVVGNGTDEANYISNNLYSVSQSSLNSPATNYLTAVGSFTNSASYYGTYDQSGDVYDLLDSSTSSNVLVQGGSWQQTTASQISSSGAIAAGPGGDFSTIGFRVASIPEPSAVMLILTAALGFGVSRRKRFIFNKP